MFICTASPFKVSLTAVYFLAFLLFSFSQITEPTDKEPDCFNGGTPYNTNIDKEMPRFLADYSRTRCNCPSGYFGSKCRIKAESLADSSIETEIEKGKFSYFYFEPAQNNYYQIQLEICISFENMKSDITAFVYFEVERNMNHIKIHPEVYQTVPIKFEYEKSKIFSQQNPGKPICKTFETPYISIKKNSFKSSDSKTKLESIVFGVSLRNESDEESNRWINFLEKIEKVEKIIKEKEINSRDASSEKELTQHKDKHNILSLILEADKVNEQISEKEKVESNSKGKIDINQEQSMSQKVSISCKYEVYFTSRNWGSYVLLISAISLVVGSLAITLSSRIKFTNRNINRIIGRETDSNVSNDEIFNLRRLNFWNNPEEFIEQIERERNELIRITSQLSESRSHKNDLSHFRNIMPVMTYEELQKRSNTVSQKYPINSLKHRIEMNRLYIEEMTRKRENLKNLKNLSEEDREIGLDHDEQLETGQQQNHHLEATSNEEISNEEINSAIEHQESANSSESKDVCTICLIAFEPTEKVRKTPCNHVFHDDCIVNWCESRLNCPICRQSLEIPRHYSRERGFPNILH